MRVATARHAAQGGVPLAARPRLMCALPAELLPPPSRLTTASSSPTPATPVLSSAASASPSGCPPLRRPQAGACRGRLPDGAPRAWAALHKLSVCCPGLLHAGVLVEPSDDGAGGGGHRVTPRFLFGIKNH
uniref:Uncharacterized protein n=1 Tax=Oryza nivara TaxID=4536 RepID=A0A0E0HFC8_ORYNI